jgi:glycosyltransferase involved in cell wall biosynthesis
MRVLTWGAGESQEVCPIGMGELRDKIRKAYVVYREHRRTARAACKTIAVGFDWPAANVGGVRRHLDSIARHSRFTVCEYPSPAAVRNWPGHRRQDYEALARRQALRQDLIHTHVEPSFIRAGMRAQEAGKPWVHTYHTMYFAEDWGGQLLPWQQEINRALVEDACQADARLCIADWFARHLQQFFGIPTDIIPNGVDVQACDAGHGPRFIAALGGDSGVLFLSSLAPIKNPVAFVEVARRFPSERFVMVGSDLNREALHRVICGELPRNVVPLGPMTSAAALDAVAACRVFVMTSHREGLPTALLEAMTMAKPCVAPRAHGCQDAIGDDRFGFLYEPGNLDDLEAKIRAALAAGSMSAARQRVLDHFSWDVVMPRIDAVYARLLEV